MQELALYGQTLKLDLVTVPDLITHGMDLVPGQDLEDTAPALFFLKMCLHRKSNEAMTYNRDMLALSLMPCIHYIVTT